MPGYSEALQKFRSGGYPESNEDKDNESEGPGGVRVIKLSEEEAKELQPYQEKFGPGEEMVIEATGKLEGTSFRVMSVKYAQGGGAPDENKDAEEMMNKFRATQGPMMPSQTVPSAG